MASSEQREGRPFGKGFAGRSTRQGCHARKTLTRLSIPNRILRTLHAPASRRDEKKRKKNTHTHTQREVGACSTHHATHRKQQKGRHSRQEFRGRSTRQRRDGPKPPRESSFAPRNLRKLHAPATRRDHAQGRPSRREFRGRSPRQRHTGPRTPRGSSFVPRISGNPGASLTVA